MKGDDVYVWQARSAEGWGTIAAGTHDIGEAVVVRALVTRSRHLAEAEMRELAQVHRITYGVAIRLGLFKLATVLEFHKPDHPQPVKGQG